MKHEVDGLAENPRISFRKVPGSDYWLKYLEAFWGAYEKIHPMPGI